MNESLAELGKLVTAEVGIQVLMIQLKNAKAGRKHWVISTCVFATALTLSWV